MRVYLGVGIGVLSMSLAAIFIRLADAPPLTVAAYRMGIAALVVGAALGLLAGVAGREEPAASSPPPPAAATPLPEQGAPQTPPAATPEDDGKDGDKS